MIMYLLIGLSLVLIGIVGLQFTYLFYVDRLDRERKKYIRSLEKKCLALGKELDEASRQIKEQKALMPVHYAESMTEDEVWADVIEDR